MLDYKNKCNYNNYIENFVLFIKGTITMEKQIRARNIKLVPIGNSKGVRIPKELLEKYGLNNALLLEETDRGLLLRNIDDNKLSWEETYQAMADEKEDWSDFDATLLDGLKIASKMENPSPDQLCK